MRDIKFRAWDKFGETMITSDELLVANSPYLKHSLIDTKKLKLMQYTGLKDRNGVEVYEGDVVKYLTHTAHVFWSPKDFGFVHYNEVIGGYAGLSFFIGYKDFEVVGNIHQHPELLEQKQ